MKFFLHLIFAVIAIQASSQAVTIGHEPVPVEYYRIPDEPLDASYKTYSVEIDTRTGELMNSCLSELSLENEYLNLAGYQKVLSRGDVHFEVSLGDFNVSSERRGTQQVKNKDKDGKETTKTHYYLEVRYAQPIAWQVTDKKGKTLKDEYIYRWSDDQTWRSINYSSLSELERYWQSSRRYKLSELQKSRIQQGMKVIHDMMNNLYGYKLINENERFEKIGKKKHPAYEGYNTAVETVKKSFKLMDADKSLSEVKKAVQPAIDFYKSADAKCVANDKDGIKLKHIGLYNLGLIYLWLEDFDQAKTYAENIYKFDPKDKDAKRLLDEIYYVETSLQRAKRPSRHQVVVGGKA